MTPEQRPGDALNDAGIEAMEPREFVARFPNATQLADGQRITPELAERLATETGMSASFWMNLQTARDNFEAVRAA